MRRGSDNVLPSFSYTERGYMSMKMQKFRTDEFDARLVPSHLHQLYESKLPFISLSKLPIPKFRIFLLMYPGSLSVPLPVCPVAQSSPPVHRCSAVLHRAAANAQCNNAGRRAGDSRVVSVPYAGTVWPCVAHRVTGVRRPIRPGDGGQSTASGWRTAVSRS